MDSHQELGTMQLHLEGNPSSHPLPAKATEMMGRENAAVVTAQPSAALFKTPKQIFAPRSPMYIVLRVNYRLQ